MKRILLSVLTALAMVALTIPMATAPVLASQILLIKEVTPPSPNVYHVGDTITYELTVANPATNTATNTLAVVHDFLPDGTTVTLATNLVQAPGDSNTFTTTYVVRAADIVVVGGVNRVINTLHATGTDSNGDGIDATTQRNSTVIQPDIAVTKVADPLLSKTDDIVTYTITVSNTGDTELTGITVVDSLLGSLVPPFSATLAAGASETFGFQRVTLADDDDPLVNTVTVTGTDVLGLTVTSTDSASVDLVHPDYTLTKTADPTVGSVGTLITYTFVITNTGDVQLNKISAIDSLIGDLTASFPASLAPGDSVTVPAARAIQAGDPNPLDNTITTVYQVDGLPNQLTRDASARVIIANPSIEVTKTANTEISKAGDEVIYTITITNTGDTELTGITVIDSLLGNISGSFPPVLGPGQSATAIFPRTVLPIDPDPLVNTVTVSGTFESITVTASASATVDLVHPDYTLTKAASLSSASVGDPITYTFVITNTGDVQLNRISAVDTLIGDLTSSFPASLAPGESATVTATRNIQSGDPSPLVNVITTVYQVDGLPNELTREARASVIITGNEGLTPGFWKNHTDLWVTYSPDQTLESVFDVPDSLGLDNKTLLEALEFKGGNGVKGMAQILLRAAVAALLNAAHPEVEYSLTEAQIISDVNDALASGDRGVMEAVKNILDALNNLGGGIDAHGNPI
ncbi:MAG: DUF11 domain-containing protein [Chloroflexi bacterium]|nr:DUF11 domain-containing protein [Chloroflexota bacterium]